MARARNIKPAFFLSESLADIDPLARLLFIGLWTLADFQGNLKWTPRKIKIQILPYDDCDIKKLAINLDKSGVIRFYSDSKDIYLNIPNFTKHQNPHRNEREKGSDLPEYTDDHRQAIDLIKLTINHDKSRSEPEYSASDRADSLLLIPDSLNTDSRENNTKTDQQDSEKEKEPEPVKQKKKKFSPPSREQVVEYFSTQNCFESANQGNTFFDHFNSNGWKVGGKAPMKNWNSAANNWIRKIKPVSNHNDNFAGAI